MEHVWSMAARRLRNGLTGTECALLRLSGLANGILAAFGDGGGEEPHEERRNEARQDFLGRKVILRQFRSLGIMHLRNLSRGGVCGLTDMPLEIGSIVFVEINRPHFYAARVVWATNLRIGLALYKPLKPETMSRLQAEQQAKAKSA
jgi:hypothetical protein